MSRERLQKVLAAAGVASRRKAEALIAEGRVAVNGRVVTEAGTLADPGRDRILVDGRPLPSPPPTYLIFHKPGGVITTLSDPERRESITDFLPPEVPRVFPVGRLDWDVQGVLLLTNDGELANALLHPSRKVLKVYRAKVLGVPPEAALDALRDGVDIPVGDGDEEGPAAVRGRAAPGASPPAQARTTPAVRTVRTAPAHEVALLSTRAGKSWVGIVIHEGKNRQIKRMFEAVGLRVLKLRRDAFAGLTARGLPIGRLRALLPGEVAALRTLAGLAVPPARPGRPAGPPTPGGLRTDADGGAGMDLWTPAHTIRGGPYGPFGGRRGATDKGPGPARSGGRGRRG